MLLVAMYTLKHQNSSPQAVQLVVHSHSGSIQLMNVLIPGPNSGPPLPMSVLLIAIGSKTTVDT